VPNALSRSARCPNRRRKYAARTAEATPFTLPTLPDVPVAINITGHIDASGTRLKLGAPLLAKAAKLCCKPISLCAD